MSFKKDKYAVVKKAISNELASFCFAYFSNKRKVAKHLQETHIVITQTRLWKLY